MIDPDDAAIVSAPIVVDPSPLAMIDRAVSAGYKGEELRCLFDLFTENNKQVAAQRFADALTAFQAQCPPIVKHRDSKGDNLHFRYAAYDDVDRVARPLMAKYRIVATYTTEPSKEPVGIRVTCRVRVGTHQEETTLTVPIPLGKVNATQLYGQAVTYAKRYALCAALNIVVTDEDTDGAFGDTTLDADQITEINTLIDECMAAGRPVDLPAFHRWLKAESLADVLAAKCTDIVRFLKKKRDGGK